MDETEICMMMMVIMMIMMMINSDDFTVEAGHPTIVMVLRVESWSS